MGKKFFWQLSSTPEDKTLDEQKEAEETRRKQAARDKEIEDRLYRDRLAMIEYTRDNVPDVLNNMYRFGIKEDYIEGPYAHDYSHCSGEFLDNDILIGFKRKFEDLGYVLSWRKKYRYWSYGSSGTQYPKHTLQYWFYLQPTKDVKAPIAF
jgi:hypothetical protein